MMLRKTSVDLSSSSTIRSYKTDVIEKLSKCGLLKGEILISKPRTNFK